MVSILFLFLFCLLLLLFSYYYYYYYYYCYYPFYNPQELGVVKAFIVISYHFFHPPAVYAHRYFYISTYVYVYVHICASLYLFDVTFIIQFHHANSKQTNLRSAGRINDDLALPRPLPCIRKKFSPFVCGDNKWMKDAPSSIIQRSVSWEKGDFISKATSKGERLYLLDGGAEVQKCSLSCSLERERDSFNEMAEEFASVAGVVCRTESAVQQSAAAAVSAAMCPEARADEAAVKRAAEALHIAEARCEELAAALRQRESVGEGLQVVGGAAASTSTSAAPALASLTPEALSFRLRQAVREVKAKDEALDKLQQQVQARQAERLRRAQLQQSLEAQRREQEAAQQRAAFAARQQQRAAELHLSVCGGQPEAGVLGRVGSIPIKSLSQLPRTQPSSSSSPGGARALAAPSQRSAPLTREEYSAGELLPNLYRVTLRHARKARYEDDTDMEAYANRMAKRRKLEELQRQQQRQQQQQGPSSGGGSTAVSPSSIKAEAEDDPALPAGAQGQQRGAQRASPTAAPRPVPPVELIDVDALMEAEDNEFDSALQRIVHTISRHSQEEEVGGAVNRREHQRRGEADDEKRRGARGSPASPRQEATHASAPTPPWAPAAEPPAVVDLGRGVSIPALIYTRLLDFQQEGLQWLLQLHHQRLGGILGDEMGLGKTIQVAAFLCALSHSHQLRGPVLLAAPVTVLRQWLAELHRWSPRTRVMVLHQPTTSAPNPPSPKAMAEMIRGQSNTILLTSYASMRQHCDVLRTAGFQYVILDEGHKISNPQAGITLAAKSFPTPHRLLLTGTPIQNSLKELWCLFDFVKPGILGTLNAFTGEFEEVINKSKNSKASALVLSEAVEAAKLLQQRIGPFLLRRLKRQVNAQLPEKYERVIYVPLSDEQLHEYVALLASPTVQKLIAHMSSYQMISGKLNRDLRDSEGCLHVAGRSFKLANRSQLSGLHHESFMILHRLRQICNHVDIYRLQSEEEDDRRTHLGDETGRSGGVQQPMLDNEEYGVWGAGGAGGGRAAKTAKKKTAVSHSFRSNLPPNLGGSAKLQTLQHMLDEWKAGGHRALVFSQTRMMLDIIENMVETQAHRYVRMDGVTPVAQRQELMDLFNQDDSIFVALLTTRVGGVGLNLIGADRVVIFDPDWNPTTDSQARERAWRVGQRRDVCVYRMITIGTVEEFIFKRQLAKSYVTDKVLSDPSYQRFFMQESFVEGLQLGGFYDARVPDGMKHVLLFRDASGLYGGVGGGGEHAASGSPGGAEVVVKFEDYQSHQAATAAAANASVDSSAYDYFNPASPVGEAAVANAEEAEAEERLLQEDTAEGTAVQQRRGRRGIPNSLAVLRNLIDGADASYPNTGANVVAQRLAAVQVRQRMNRVMHGGPTSAARNVQQQQQEYEQFGDRVPFVVVRLPFFCECVFHISPFVHGNGYEILTRIRAGFMLEYGVDSAQPTQPARRRPPLPFVSQPLSPLNVRGEEGKPRVKRERDMGRIKYGRHPICEWSCGGCASILICFLRYRNSLCLLSHLFLFWLQVIECISRPSPFRFNSASVALASKLLFVFVKINRLTGGRKLCFSKHLQTLQHMLDEWKAGGHRALVFSQTRMMLDIIENMVETQAHRYVRMDGVTPVAQRQELMDLFNQDDSIFVALLTTRVGGVGLNLIGADRVVIFDPDWNPTTDSQARERAWRVGQRRDVCVYRMITIGTVEEFIFKRQLAKSYVTDKVLSDPSYQRFFMQESFVEGLQLGGFYDARVPDGMKHVLLFRDASSPGGAEVVVKFEDYQSHQAATAAAANASVDSSAYDYFNPASPVGEAAVANAEEAEAEERLLQEDTAEGTAVQQRRGRRGIPNVERSAAHACSPSSPTAGGESLAVLRNLIDGADASYPNTGANVVAQRLAAVQVRQRMNRVMHGGPTSAARNVQQQQQEYEQFGDRVPFVVVRLPFFCECVFHISPFVHGNGYEILTRIRAGFMLEYGVDSAQPTQPARRRPPLPFVSQPLSPLNVRGEEGKPRVKRERDMGRIKYGRHPICEWSWGCASILICFLRYRNSLCLLSHLFLFWLQVIECISRPSPFRFNSASVALASKLLFVFVKINRLTGGRKLCFSKHLQTLQHMLDEWKAGGHRALVFSQTRMMLDIIENMVETQAHRYVRMDGVTPVAQRQELMDLFNQDDSIFVALLTTRVGGVGLNLIGADRVVIFDPDWNPTTDSQARERAWRVGQRRDVCVYRMITIGTVEEFIFKRQLAKSYVTDKVLSDPSYQRFFMQESFVEGLQLGGFYDARVPDGMKHVLLFRDASGLYGGVLPVVVKFEDYQSHQAATAAAANASVDSSAYDYFNPASPVGEAAVANAEEAEAEERLLQEDTAEGTAVQQRRGRRGIPNVERSAAHACSPSSPTAGGESLAVLRNLIDGADASYPNTGANVVAQRLAAVQVRQRMNRVMHGGPTSAARNVQQQQQEYEQFGDRVPFVVVRLPFFCECVFHISPFVHGNGYEILTRIRAGFMLEYGVDSAQPTQPARRRPPLPFVSQPLSPLNVRGEEGKPRVKRERDMGRIKYGRHPICEWSCGGCASILICFLRYRNSLCLLSHLFLFWLQVIECISRPSPFRFNSASVALASKLLFVFVKINRLTGGRKLCFSKHTILYYTTHRLDISYTVCTRFSSRIYFIIISLLFTIRVFIVIIYCILLYFTVTKFILARRRFVPSGGPQRHCPYARSHALVPPAYPREQQHSILGARASFICSDIESNSIYDRAGSSAPRRGMTDRRGTRQMIVANQQQPVYGQQGCMAGPKRRATHSLLPYLNSNPPNPRNKNNSNQWTGNTTPRAGPTARSAAFCRPAALFSQKREMAAPSASMLQPHPPLPMCVSPQLDREKPQGTTTAAAEPWATIPPSFHLPPHTPPPRKRIASNPLARPSLALSVHIMIAYHAINAKYLCECKLQRYDDEKGALRFVPGLLIADRYRVEALMGKGTFGTVFDCFDLRKRCRVAVKVIRSGKYYGQQGSAEAKMLRHLRTNPRLENLVVHLLDETEWLGHVVLVFELLSFNLLQLLHQTQFNGVSLDLVRKFTWQLLLVFLQLERHDPPILHCDLKPENISLVTHNHSAIRVIDFGSAQLQQTPRGRRRTATIPASADGADAGPGSLRLCARYIQSRYYRSPEVILELGCTTAIDRWSLACVLVELHTGRSLFPGEDEAHMLECFERVLGPIPSHLIEASPRKDVFYVPTPTFIASTSPVPALYRLKQLRGPPSSRHHHEEFSPRGPVSPLEEHDVRSYEIFLDFVSKLLLYDPKERMTCEEAVKHPFLAPFHTHAANEQSKPVAPPPTPPPHPHPTPQRTVNGATSHRHIPPHCRHIVILLGGGGLLVFTFWFSFLYSFDVTLLCFIITIIMKYLLVLFLFYFTLVCLCVCACVRILFVSVYIYIYPRIHEENLLAFIFSVSVSLHLRPPPPPSTSHLVIRLAFVAWKKKEGKEDGLLHPRWDAHRSAGPATCFSAIMLRVLLFMCTIVYRSVAFRWCSLYIYYFIYLFIFVLHFVSYFLLLLCNTCSAYLNTYLNISPSLSLSLDRHSMGVLEFWLVRAEPLIVYRAGVVVLFALYGDIFQPTQGRFHVLPLIRSPSVYVCAQPTDLLHSEGKRSISVYIYIYEEIWKDAVLRRFNLCIGFHAVRMIAVLVGDDHQQLCKRLVCLCWRGTGNGYVTYDAFERESKDTCRRKVGKSPLLFFFLIIIIIIIEMYGFHVPLYLYLYLFQLTVIVVVFVIVIHLLILKDVEEQIHIAQLCCVVNKLFIKARFPYYSVAEVCLDSSFWLLSEGSLVSFRGGVWPVLIITITFIESHLSLSLSLGLRIEHTPDGRSALQSTPGDRRALSSSSNSSPVHGQSIGGVPQQNGNALSNFYANKFPAPEELEYSIMNEMATVDDLREVVAELRRQVDVLTEETKLITRHADTLRHHHQGGGGHRVGGGAEQSPTFLAGEDNEDDLTGRTISMMEDSLDSETSDRVPPSSSMELGNAAGRGSGSSRRTGQSGNYRGGKSSSEEMENALVLIEDKLMLLNKEGDRLRQQEDKAYRESEEIRDLLMATVEEASRRMKELRLEMIKFNREVMDEESGTASANLLRLYMERRAAAQKSYLDKLLGQCQATEEDIARAQQQLRTRRAAGEAFHAIDFEQLRIENQQFNERIEKKNQELVELKGTSTRTVQMLNMLMDQLNFMTNEQLQLRKEYKSRCDYLSRCEKEVVIVEKEAGKAEGRHHALRAQHEAVKVPKIEEYIGQKAELFELEKACKNWQRKVEIAEGQRQVLRQQLARLRKQRDAAIEYSQNKKKRLQENLGKCPTKLPAINHTTPKLSPPPGAVPEGFAPVDEDEAPRGNRKGFNKPKLAPRKGSRQAAAANKTSDNNLGDAGASRRTSSNANAAAAGSATTSEPHPPSSVPEGKGAGNSTAPTDPGTTREEEVPEAEAAPAVQPTEA
eukprot:gene8964-6287_t